MILAWSVADVRRAEEDLLAGLPEGELMARAVRGLVGVALARLGSRSGRRVVALVGPGNNGADALYAAARLADEGFEVAAVRTDRCHEGALDSAVRAGVALVEGDPAPALADADLVLDGITGLGGRPGLPAYARPWVEAVPDDAYVLAVDLPSGHDPAGGALDPDGVFADETVTFAVPKPVHLIGPAEPAVGLLTVLDIGLEVKAPATVARITADDVPRLWPVPSATDDKYSRGVLGLVGGTGGYTGAPVLAATAAVTTGVGMLRFVGAPESEDRVRSAVPEAVVGDGRVQAWAIGPGLDPDDVAPEIRGVIEQALASDLPVLLDAGGLHFLDGPRQAPTLLTPHAGECATMLTRLTGATVSRAEVTADPLAAARRLSDHTSATVLLKGANTIIVGADRDEPVISQRDAPAWSATAGAGDVLSGIAGALLAAGVDPHLAGGLAALVHGRAVDHANPGGPVRALDIAHATGPAVAALLRG